MTTADQRVGGPAVKLPSPATLKALEDTHPGAFELIWEEVTCEGVHRRSLEQHRCRMEVAELGSRVFGQLCGLGSVVVLAVLAKYFVDHDAPTQGAAIIGSGAATIVGIFVTGRWIDRRSGTDDTPAEN
jgi:hypothetical protein